MTVQRPSGPGSSSTARPGPGRCLPSARNRDMQYKVLIVDDSKLARMIMASALRRLRPDWELREVTSADEALDTISAESIDIALIDFNMPGTDGLELVANIRK